MCKHNNEYEIDVSKVLGLLVYLAIILAVWALRG